MESRFLTSSLCVLCISLLCICLVPQAAQAHLMLPEEEQLKLYPEFPTHAVGTTDAAKKLEAKRPKGIVIPKASTEVSSSVVVVKLSELVNASSRFNDQVVQFEAEAVGDIIEGPDGYKWVLFDDGTGSISALVPEDYIQLISHLGRYSVKGSVLRITGVYKIADNDQSGEMDVRVYSAELLDEGENVSDTLDKHRLYLGFAFIVFACLLFIFYQSVSKRAGK